MTRRRTADALKPRPQPHGAPRLCDHPGCEAAGDFPAPRSRDALRQYYWFCLEHVRAYNASWNYYAGMNEAEIERHIRADTTWWRPTWPLGAGQARRYEGEAEEWVHKFDAFGDTAANNGFRDNAKQARTAGNAEMAALAVMDLELPLTLKGLKARYKELVKRFHPDANGGNKESEEQLKLINRAYATLKNSLSA